MTNEEKTLQGIEEDWVERNEADRLAWEEEMREREVRDLNYETRCEGGETKTCRGDYCVFAGKAVGVASVEEDVCSYCQMIESGIAAGEGD